MAGQKPREEEKEEEEGRRELKPSRALRKMSVTDYL